MQSRNAATASGHGGKSVPAAQQRRFEVMLKRAENRVCFDCGARQPRWASTNLGIFFCLRCAGIHRSLGVHISKVKSTNMDAWEEPMIEFIEHVGNGRGRMLYEYNMPELSKPRTNTDTGVVERVLRLKYEKKEYYNPKFNELLAEFMRTPITDGESGLNGDVAAAQAEEREVERQRQQHVERLQQEQQLAEAQRMRAQAAAQLEELWGAPVSSTNAPAAPSVREEVAELFANPTPAGRAPQPSANPFWGMAGVMHQPPPSQSQQQMGRPANAWQGGGPSYALNGFFSSPSPSSVGGTSPSAPRQSPGFPGNPTLAPPPPPTLQQQQRPAAAPSPATGPAEPARKRGGGVDDLFGGVTPTPPPPHQQHPPPPHGSKDEILSLFSSAPPVGSYSGGGGGGGGYAGPQYPSPSHGQGGGATYVAWQPHVVRPYYSPEK